MISLIDIQSIYIIVKKRAECTIFRRIGAKLIEAADFGLFYGFLFEHPNIYDNAYWCVNKKTFEQFMFLPVQNYEAFNNRKILDIHDLKEA